MAAILPRLAIGLSHDPIAFDRCRILPLCFADPPSLRGSALVSVSCQDHADPIFAGRSVTSAYAPRSYRRTGYGTRLRWAIELTFETLAGQAGQFPGVGPTPDVPDMPTTIPLIKIPTDNSLFVLASAFGRSSARSKMPPSTFTSPPHLFLTTTYQTSFEQWFPVDVHPDNTSSSEQPFSLKTWMRTMAFELVTRDTFMDIGIAYEPAAVVHSGSGLVTGLTAPAPGRTNATLTFNAPLRSDVRIGDILLVQFAETGTFVFYRFSISSIDNARTTVQAVSPIVWPYGVPGHAAMSYWTMQADPFYKVPVYIVYDYAGNIWPYGFTPNQGYTVLIG